MEFILRINLESASLRGDEDLGERYNASELARQIHRVANMIEISEGNTAPFPRAIVDVNGNRIGSFMFGL